MMTNEKKVEKRTEAAIGVGEKAATAVRAKNVSVRSSEKESASEKHRGGSQGRKRRRTLSEGWEIDLEGHVHEPRVSGAVGGAGEADGEVPAAPEEGSGEDVPGNLDEDRRSDEDGPRVHATGILASFEELTEAEELGLELLRAERGNL
jgi:hypothetical protein